MSFARSTTFTASRGLQLMTTRDCVSPKSRASSLTVAAPRQSAANQTDQSAALSRDAATIRLDALLFGETQSRVVISCKALDAVKVVERAKLMGVPAVQIGKVGGDKLTVKTASGEFSAPLTELHDAWWNAIARAMA